MSGHRLSTAEIESALVSHPAVAQAAVIAAAEDLPKTKSGKIMRRLLRDVAEGHETGDVTTLRDPSVLAALQRRAAPGQQL